MATNSKKTKNIIEKKLNGIPIKKLSKQSGFCKRKPQKIEPKKLLISFLLTIWDSKKNTYNNWAIKLGFLIKGTVSRQAIWKRMGQSLVKFLESVLKKLMEQSLQIKIEENVSEKLKLFKRILIEDSTTIRLNDKLSKEYPGSRNKSNKEIALLKIQTTYDILKRRFVRFGITNFRNNDQNYSNTILEVAQEGDLIIRDLGYFVLRVFVELKEKGIYFLSRLSKTVSIYKAQEGKKTIDLAHMLRKRGNLDAKFYIGETERLPIRIIAIPVEKEVAEKRRREARHNRDRRLNPTKNNLILMGWNLFITNVSEEKLNFKEIEQLYSIRWRIEIIYKCWKSYMGITDVPRDANKTRIEAFIYSMLIFILLFQVYFYEFYLNKFSGNNQKISLMKLMQFTASNVNSILLSESNTVCLKLLNQQIYYHCLYEKRKDRINYNQFILKLG